MIKLVILILVALLSVGYYFGYFTKDDSVNDIITKSKDIANKKANELKDKAKDKVEEIKDVAKDKLNTIKENR